MPRAVLQVCGGWCLRTILVFSLNLDQAEQYRGKCFEMYGDLFILGVIFILIRLDLMYFLATLNIFKTRIDI